MNRAAHVTLNLGMKPTAHLTLNLGMRPAAHLTCHTAKAYVASKSHPLVRVTLAQPPLTLVQLLCDGHFLVQGTLSCSWITFDITVGRNFPAFVRRMEPTFRFEVLKQEAEDICLTGKEVAQYVREQQKLDREKRALGEIPRRDR